MYGLLTAEASCTTCDAGIYRVVEGLTVEGPLVDRPSWRPEKIRNTSYDIGGNKKQRWSGGSKRRKKNNKRSGLQKHLSFYYETTKRELNRKRIYESGNHKIVSSVPNGTLEFCSSGYRKTVIKKKSYCCKGPQRLFTKFTTQKRKIKKENQSFFITTILCFPEWVSVWWKTKI